MTNTVQEYIENYSIDNITAEAVKLIDLKQTTEIVRSQHAHESFQRNVVWDKDRKALFISSIS